MDKVLTLCIRHRAVMSHSSDRLAGDMAMWEMLQLKLPRTAQSYVPLPPLHGPFPGHLARLAAQGAVHFPSARGKTTGDSLGWFPQWFRSPEPYLTFREVEKQLSGWSRAFSRAQRQLWLHTHIPRDTDGGEQGSNYHPSSRSACVSNDYVSKYCFQATLGPWGSSLVCLDVQNEQKTQQLICGSSLYIVVELTNSWTNAGLCFWTGNKTL